MNDMSTLFLFGAGASYGSQDCSPRRPPLGAQLFDDLQGLGGVAASLPAPIATAFRANFENGMMLLFEQENEKVAAFLREMSGYLATFRAGPDNCYARLLDIIRRQRSLVVLSTLNYDTLLEQSISLRRCQMSFTASAVPDGVFRVRKPHGSCHFLPDLGGMKFINCTTDTRDGGIAIDAPIRVEQNMLNVIAWCRDSTSFAPAVAMYAKGKRVLHCPEFVAQQQILWSQDVAAASRIVVVGVAVNSDDEHIWKPLAKSRAKLAYIGMDKTSFENWRRSNRRRHAMHIANTFVDGLNEVESFIRRI